MSEVVAAAIDARRPLYFTTAAQSYDALLETFPRVPPPSARQQRSENIARVSNESIAIMWRGAAWGATVNLNAVASSATGSNLHLAQLSLRHDCEA